MTFPDETPHDPETAPTLDEIQERARDYKGPWWKRAALRVIHWATGRHEWTFDDEGGGMLIQTEPDRDMLGLSCPCGAKTWLHLPLGWSVER